MIRVFVVDDHPLLRDGLRSLLARDQGITIVGDAAHGQDLLDQLPATPADVVLLDLNMPVLDGLATAARLRKEFPAVRILVLSMNGHAFTIGRALNAGAHGYVLKNAALDEIVAGIRAVASGKEFLSSELGLGLLHQVLTRDDPVPDPAEKHPGRLTFREREVLQLIAQGLTNNEIADRLFTSRRTVETHRQNLILKTQAKNTAALIKYAAQNGLIAPE